MKTLVKYSFILFSLLAVPGLALALMAWFYFGFSGVKVVQQVAGRRNADFLPLYPGTRLDAVQKDELGRPYQSLHAEPVYVSVKMPRQFAAADFEVWYKNAGVEEFKVGLEKGEGQFELQPVEFQPLETILADKANWDITASPGTLLVQRKAAKQYGSVPGFISALPPTPQIATYNYDLSASDRLSGYQASPKENVVAHSLRGRHVFWVYIKDEPLDISFKVQDINRAAGPDPVEVMVTRNNELVLDKALENDGKSVRPGPASWIRLQKPGLAEGAYKIIFNADDDIFIREIRTRQRKFVMENQVYLADNQEYRDAFPDILVDPSQIYFRGSRLSAFTSHYRGLQALKVGGRDVDLNQTHRPVSIDLSDMGGQPAPLKIVSPKNDVKFQGSGYFSFSEDAFFEPDFGSLSSGTAGYNYILAGYRPPVDEGGLKHAELNFNLAGAMGSNRQIRFVLSAPSISADKPLKIYRIKATLIGRKLGLGYVWNKLLHRDDSE